MTITKLLVIPLTVVFLQFFSGQTKAQSFICRSAVDPNNPTYGICILGGHADDFGCQESYRGAADDWCQDTNNIQYTDCHPNSTEISCQVLGQPPSIPPSCVPEPCDHTLYFVCPGTQLCCLNDTDCPAPVDPTLLPCCSRDSSCQADWDGHEGVAYVFDAYQGCVAPTTSGGLATCDRSTCGSPSFPAYCDSNGNYTSVPSSSLSTAMGCIDYNSATALTLSLLKIALSVVGGIALLLIIVAGFMIMTSQGNPDRLRASQELLTSAFTGLIMILFSVMILHLIGVIILQIPGLS